MRGYTLIEVIVAMVIFGGGVLGVVVGLSAASSAAAEAERYVGAARLAERRIAWAGLELDTPLGAESGQEGVYRWRVQRSAGPAGTVEATAEVRWRDRGVAKVFALREVLGTAGGWGDE